MKLITFLQHLNSNLTSFITLIGEFGFNSNVLLLNLNFI